MDPTKIKIAPTNPEHERGSTTPRPTPSTPGPAYPANTPVANPTFIGDEPYRSPRPAKPDTNK